MRWRRRWHKRPATPVQRSQASEPLPVASPERVAVEAVEARPMRSGSPLLVMVEPVARPTTEVRPGPVVELVKTTVPSMAEPVRVSAVGGGDDAGAAGGGAERRG